MRTEAEKIELGRLIKRNQHQIFIVSPAELDQVFSKTKCLPETRETWGRLRNKVEFTANYAAAADDSVLLAKLMGDIGFSGARAYVKRYKGKPYIILKGNPRLRTIFTGTRYGLQNAKVVQMGLGKYGAINAAKGGGILSIVLISAYRVVDYFLRDSATLTQLVGTLATDVVKVGLATGASIAAAVGASAIAGVGIVAIGPLVVAIVFGVIVTAGLNTLDDQFGITERVVAALDEVGEKGLKGLVHEQKDKMTKQLNKKANEAVDSLIDQALEAGERLASNALNRILRRHQMPWL